MSALDDVLSWARGLIGRWEDEDCGTMAVKEFCRYAVAVDDVDYLRRARAREAAGEPVEAPPLFLAATMSWEDGPAEEELQPDGLAFRESPCTQGLPVRQVHGGQAVRLTRPRSRAPGSPRHVRSPRPCGSTAGPATSYSSASPPASSRRTGPN